MSEYRNWQHCSGWRVEHCGHPTALYPYLLISPKGQAVVSFNGHAFTSMLAAQWAVKAIAAGMVSIIDGCAQITADGRLEPIERRTKCQDQRLNPENSIR